ncbi:MAG: hypothetical protein AAB465_03340 [Patescibacteria group bacterium]
MTKSSKSATILIQTINKIFNKNNKTKGGTSMRKALVVTLTSIIVAIAAFVISIACAIVEGAVALVISNVAFVTFVIAVGIAAGAFIVAVALSRK